MMYRMGLTYGQIAVACNAPRSTVHRHLQGRQREDAGLRLEHVSNLPRRQEGPVRDRWTQSLQEVISFIDSVGRQPSKGPTRAERALASWLSLQRTEHKHGRLSMSKLAAFADLHGWETPERTRADRKRWEERLDELNEFVLSERRWPRYKVFRSESERVLGVWLHGQRQKNRSGSLTALQVAALNENARGWDGTLRTEAIVDNMNGVSGAHLSERGKLTSIGRLRCE